VPIVTGPSKDQLTYTELVIYPDRRIKMWKAVQRFEENKAGKDFVCGDVHGAYGLLDGALELAGFDPARDRLFSVGDLINRGSESHRVEEFLARPYVHAIQGNHEDTLVKMHQDGRPNPAMLRHWVQNNGMRWWPETAPERQQTILAAVSALPYIIEVETQRGLVGLVHADIPPGMDWQTFVAYVEAGDPAVMKDALWGRDRIEAESETGVEGIGRVFVGHTPQWGGMRRYGNVFAIDTGAVFAELGYERDGRMTLANLLTQTQVLAARTEPTLLDIRDAPSDTPFGNYVTHG
jgi:serine/threonine protein phosphatase 1